MRTIIVSWALGCLFVWWGCGSITEAPDPPVDAGAEVMSPMSRHDASIELELHDASMELALEARPPISLPACAAALPSSSCSSCPRGPTGEDLTSQCRAVVACVASDPHYSPLVQTCAMQVGPGAESCVAALLAGCGT
jgi:hypothetical protein